MKLSEFVKITKEDIDRFEKHWQENVKKNPEFYPDELDEGTWFDQFLTFLTSSIEEDFLKFDETVETEKKSLEEIWQDGILCEFCEKFKNHEPCIVGHITENNPDCQSAYENYILGD